MLHMFYGDTYAGFRIANTSLFLVKLNYINCDKETKFKNFNISLFNIHTLNITSSKSSKRVVTFSKLCNSKF